MCLKSLCAIQKLNKNPNSKKSLFETTKIWFIIADAHGLRICTWFNQIEFYYKIELDKKKFLLSKMFSFFVIDEMKVVKLQWKCQRKRSQNELLFNYFDSFGFEIGNLLIFSFISLFRWVSIFVNCFSNIINRLKRIVNVISVL